MASAPRYADQKSSFRHLPIGFAENFLYDSRMGGFDGKLQFHCLQYNQWMSSLYFVSHLYQYGTNRSRHGGGMGSALCRSSGLFAAVLFFYLGFNPAVQEDGFLMSKTAPVALALH